MSHVDQRSTINSATGKAEVTTQALDGHEMTDFSDNSHLLRDLPRYPAAAHRIHVQTDVDIQDEPRNGAIPQDGRLDV